MVNLLAPSLARALFAEHPVPLWIHDARTLEFMDVNQAAIDLYGYSRDEFLGSTIDRLRPLDGFAAAADAEGVVRHRTKSGDIVHVNLKASRIRFLFTDAYLVSACEITRAQQAEDRLKQSEATLELAQRIASIGSYSYDRVTGERSWSDELYRIFGIDTATPILVDGLWPFTHPDDAERVRSAIQRAREERTSFSVDYRIVQPDGSMRYVNEQGYWEYAEDGSWTIHAGTVQDITARKKQECEIRTLAYRDKLTGTLNRTGLLEQLQALLLDRPQKYATALLYFDLDRFKAVNDTLGHKAGDGVLASVAQRLTARLHGAELLARAGGDEFAVVIPALTSRAHAAERASALLQAFVTPVIVGGEPHALEASCGIALFPDDARDVDDLLRNADVAMYAAKADGGNRYAFFTAQLHADAAKRFDLERGLRGALRGGEFDLFYQPVLSTSTCEIVSMEALLRWNNARFADVNTETFVQFAEETRLIRDIGEWVLRCGLSQAAQWQRCGIAKRVWINVSAGQLGENLPDILAKLMDDYGVRPHSFGLELTETAFISANAETLAVLHAIKALGIPLALDDFGAKFSSLDYLQRLPIDVIKIDRSFITRCDADAFKRAVIEAVVRIARELRCTVVAEGVESESELQTVTELGCDRWQGHYFAPAQSATEIAALIGAVPQ